MMNNPTEKDTQQPAQPKKNRIILIIGVILALCVIVAAVFTVVRTFRSDNPTEPTVDNAALAEAAKNTIAVTIGDHQINAVELNYYYIETVNNFLQQYGSYLSYFMDVYKPLNEQKCTFDESMTWADYLMSIAQENMKSTYMLCDLAEANDFTLSEAERAYLKQMQDAITQYAAQYKYESADAYLVDVFGHGADMESYLAYFERSLLADAYYSYYAENLTYTDEQIREYESKDPHLYNSYSYATYYLDVKKFLTGGSEGSDGNVTYTDEQKAAAIAAATEAANSLLGSTCATQEEFNQLLLGLEINSNLTSIATKEKTDLFYNATDDFFQKWYEEETRTVGQIAVIPKLSSVDDGEVIQGYYIVWFSNVNDNVFKMKDVRHLLVMFKNDSGKTYSDGITSFTDAQKATAKDKAEGLLAEWLSGDADEISFSALATLKSEDTGSIGSGGLYTNIYPGQMVNNFENWCYDETRVPGDYGIVETEYGYHIMYFVGDSELTYRDYVITNIMKNEDLNKWHEDLVKSAVLTELCLDYCKLDMVLAG